MKKALSFFLALVLVFGGVASVASAAKKDKVTPVIIISGYASTQLYDESGEKVWGLDPKKMLNQTLDDLPGFLVAAAGMTIGNFYGFGERLGMGGTVILEKMKCLPNGTSKYKLSTVSDKASETSFKYLSDHDMGGNIGEWDFTNQLAQLIGGENIFCFQVDFRRNAVDCAAKLRAYVKDVKKFTGADKVSIFGLSHGGLTAGVYTSLYGTEGDVNNVVMSVPALGGTKIAANILRGDTDLQIDELMCFAEQALSTNTNFARVLEGADVSWANGIAKGFFAGVNDTIGYWGSLWDFLPTEDYEELKKELLDEKEAAGLIAKSDRFHYEILPNYAENFKKAQKCGVDISILCNPGNPIAFGGDSNADIVIHASSESGAKAAPFGKRFSDGYTQCGDNCKNKKHNHVSPSMELDASFAYLPENTWFIDGQFHGMYIFEDYTLSLVKTLILTEKIKDVYSDPAYPQFAVTQNPYWGVFAKFDSSSQGYVSGNDKALTVKNISKYKLRLTSITCDGMDIAFSVRKLKALAPGEEITIPFTGKLPSASKVRAAVTVGFLQLGSPTPTRTRVFDFTVMNGAAPKYDKNSPYADADFETSLEKKTSELVYSLIVCSGMRQSLELVANLKK